MNRENKKLLDPKERLFSTQWKLVGGKKVYGKPKENEADKRDYGEQSGAPKNRERTRRYQWRKTKHQAVGRAN